MITEQLSYFLQSIFIGANLGLIFDVLKIFRLSFKHNNIVVFIEDILFFAISSIITYCFMIFVSFGQIRVFIIIGEVIGFILYRFLVSSIVLNISLWLIKILKKLFYFIFKFLILPVYNCNIKVFLFIFKPIIKIFCKIYIKLKKLLKNIFEIMYNFYKNIFYKKVNNVK